MREENNLEVHVSSKIDNWHELHREMVLEHPSLSVSMAQVRLPDGQVVMDWPEIYTRDYVNALVMNDAGEAMIIENHHRDGGWSSWQVIGGFLEDDEDPYTAVQRELLVGTGYGSNDWWYLGSYAVDTDHHIGVGHFFYATGAHRIAQLSQNGAPSPAVKWVSVKDLKSALLDGRIGIISYAANIALALLMIERNLRS